MIEVLGNICRQEFFFLFQQLYVRKTSNESPRKRAMSSEEPSTSDATPFSPVPVPSRKMRRVEASPSQAVTSTEVMDVDSETHMSPPTSQQRQNDGAANASSLAARNGATEDDATALTSVSLVRQAIQADCHPGDLIVHVQNVGTFFSCLFSDCLSRRFVGHLSQACICRMGQSTVVGHSI